MDTDGVEFLCRPSYGAQDLFFYPPRPSGADGLGSIISRLRRLEPRALACIPIHSPLVRRWARLCRPVGWILALPCILLDRDSVNELLTRDTRARLLTNRD